MAMFLPRTPLSLSTQCSKEQDERIPPVFCWSKMGTEAGQSLDAILHRKELERRAGGGVFAWGIGNSLGVSVKLAQEEVQNRGVDVLFTPMKSAAKRIDVAPSQVLLWLSYLAEDGEQTPLPSHMVVTSRGNLAQTGGKRSHYALICNGQHDITAPTARAVIDSNRARNFASLNPLGASQVTAVVRYQFGYGNLPEKSYPVTFRAKLHGAGFVRLASPVVVDGELAALYHHLCKSTTAEEWAEGASCLRQRAEEAAKALQTAQKTLFEDVLIRKTKPVETSSLPFQVAI
jgi:hypothetical protein